MNNHPCPLPPSIARVFKKGAPYLCECGQMWRAEKQGTWGDTYWAWVKVVTATTPQPNDCEHIEGGEIPYPSRGINVWLYFTFCPKCGVKL